MEEYIGRCLDSLLIPEFDQVEVLVVNDGSKDRSSEIAHSYADRYPDSIRVIDKPNGNYGSCINAALPQAKGRYVKILDADDTFDTKAFSELVGVLGNIDAEVVITGFLQVDEKGKVTRQNFSNPYKEEVGRILDVNNVLGDNLSRSMQMHKITYKRTIFYDLNYHQTEGISYTDTEWAIIPFSICKSILYIDIFIYKYLVGRDGQTMSPVQLKKNYQNFFIIGQKLVVQYESGNTINIPDQLLLDKIIDFYKFCYFTALNIWDRNVARQFKANDQQLKIEHSNIYDLIGEIPYDQSVNYQVFKKIREHNYPEVVKIPLWVKIRLSICVRLRKLGILR